MVMDLQIGLFLLLQNLGKTHPPASLSEGA